MTDNIVLIGFMGSGKNKIGALLAKDLGFELVDIDAQIEASQKKTIADIFNEQGESAFRALELAALKAQGGKQQRVLVTGGGAPTFFESFLAIKSLGEVYFLDGNFPLLLSRISRSKKRPLGACNSEDQVALLRERFLFRRPIYRTLGQTINVDHEDENQTVDDIKSRFLAKKELPTPIVIADERTPYPIYVHHGAIGGLSKVLHSLGLKNHRPVLITSTKLAHIFSPTLTAMSAQFPALTIIRIPDGETAKNPDTIAHIHQELFMHNVSRQSVIVALGGGVVGDIAGFVAATFMRGIPLIQIPTTLLSMVDSSIGGKTGVDTSFGKNLLGAFKNPHAVIIDPDILASLPREEHACGMAEVIKHGIISDPALFYDLLHNELPLENTIKRALQVKADIVASDPQEMSVRAHLNLGHTFAHAIEKVSNFKIKHGEAVAMGLMLATRLAVEQKVCQEDFLADLKKLLIKYQLPYDVPSHLDPELIIEAMAHDKKRDERGLRVILPQRVGAVVMTYASHEQLLAAFATSR